MRLQSIGGNPACFTTNIADCIPAAGHQVIQNEQTRNATKETVVQARSLCVEQLLEDFLSLWQMKHKEAGAALPPKALSQAMRQPTWPVACLRNAPRACRWDRLRVWASGPPNAVLLQDRCILRGRARRTWPCI